MPDFGRVFLMLKYTDITQKPMSKAEEYQRRFPDRRIPSRSVFTRIHQTLRDTGSLPSVSVQSEGRWYER